MSGLDEAELARRRYHIAAVGLPCVVKGIALEEDFASIVLTPVDGWTHFVPDDELAGFEARGYQ